MRSTHGSISWMSSWMGRSSLFRSGFSSAGTHCSAVWMVTLELLKTTTIGLCSRIAVCISRQQNHELKYFSETQQTKTSLSVTPMIMPFSDLSAAYLSSHTRLPRLFSRTSRIIITAPSFESCCL